MRTAITSPYSGTKSVAEIDKSPKLSSYAQKKSGSISLLLYLICLALPMYLQVGPLSIYMYRAFLIAFLIPVFYAYISGKIRFSIVDALLFLYCIWATISLIVNHGIDFAIQPAGILFIETFGSFAFARWAIRGPESISLFIKYFVLILIFLLPFAIYELNTGNPIIITTISKFLPTVPNVNIPGRAGLERVQTTFAHPILFGIFCSSLIGLAIFALSTKFRISKILIISLTLFLVFTSLSTGPFFASLFQIAFASWYLFTRNKKRNVILFFLLGAMLYILIDMTSNRPPLAVVSSYLSLNAETGYDRIRIWTYGSAEVMRHWLLGIGFHEWTRPSWMSSSIDMFWLVHAVEFGLPAALFIGSATIIVVAKLVKSEMRSRFDVQLRAAHGSRLGLLTSLIGLILGGWAVHYWGSVYSLFLFLLGSGMFEVSKSVSDPSVKLNESSRRQTRSPYARVRP